jgi:predicted nuclease with TOPRIM domain
MAQQPFQLQQQQMAQQQQNSQHKTELAICTDSKGQLQDESRRLAATVEALRERTEQMRVDLELLREELRQHRKMQLQHGRAGSKMDGKCQQEQSSRRSSMRL